MKLALFGGSFNPPHNGHITLAENALETLRPDKLIWMPSGDPPHKTLPPGTPPAAHRLAMSRLAVEGLSNVEVSDFEISGGARYTIDTVRMLHKQYRPERFWLLMGQDMRDSFETWRGADELRALTEIYVFPRNIIPVSSTELRECLDETKVPPGVWNFILRERLYGAQFYGIIHPE
jgi:nicotinate-nucleotide adenylyltransferase